MVKRHAFVTGGTGFLGLNLVEELVKRGWRVTALHRPTSSTNELKNLGAELVVGGLDNPEGLEKAVPEDVDVIFHLAGDTSVWRRGRRQQFETNVLGTRNMVRAVSARQAIRFIHTSSVVVYGFAPGRITEESPHLGELSKISYFRTKAQAEQEVHAAIDDGLDAVIINPANVIGPKDHHNWSRMITMISTNSLPGVPGGAGTFCHSKAVVRTMIEAADRGRTGRNYLLGGADATFFELVCEISRQLGSKPPTRTVPTPLLKAVAVASDLWSLLTNREPDVTPDGVALVTGTLQCSSQRAIDELGYEPASLETMVADCIAWMRAENMI